MKNIQKLKSVCIASFVLLLFFAGTGKENNSNVEKPLVKSESPSMDSKGSAALLYDSFTIEWELNGRYYLHAKVPAGGFLEWYIIENATTYTKVGETTNYDPWPAVSDIYFYFDKPAVPGYYRMWAEGPEGEGFTIILSSCLQESQFP